MAATGDRIDIIGLRLMTMVGVLRHEREAAQPIALDVSIHCDLHDAGRTDELGDTANYGAVAEAVAAVVRESKDVLLERLAARVAETVLAFERVEGVDVAVTKLRPPIPEDVTSTAVRISRTRAEAEADAERDAARPSHRALIALGSNLDDRAGFLRFAVDELRDVGAQSQVYETAPVGGPEGQGAYLNMVVAVDTRLDPFAFLRRCQRIESAAQRQRVVRWGPRTLDVDLLFYDHVHIDSPELTLPHPRIGERRFVLAPLSEVDPGRCPPGWDTTLPSSAVSALGPLDDL